MSYRSVENSSFRNQMSRPKGRAAFKHNIDPMPPSGRGRYMPNMQMPGQQPPYPHNVGYPRTNQYPTIHSPEYTMQFTQQVSAPPGWNQPIPITVSDTYQMSNQHSYPPQQPVYSPEPSHMIPIQNSAYIPQVQNQNEFDPVTNICICSKCGFQNTLALVQIKSLTEENKRLQEQLNAVERQMVNANYEDSSSSPAPQATVQLSILSVDAQPFQMGGTPALKTYQGTNVPAENSAEATSRSSHNPNGNEYPPRPIRNWQSYASTPVVSASDVSSDQYNEPTSDPDWSNVSDYSQTENVKSESSDQPTPDRPADTTPNVSAIHGWDPSEPSLQESNVVTSTSGSFAVSSEKQEDDDSQDMEQTSSTNPQREGRGTPKDDKNTNDTPKNRPKDQRLKLNRGRGGRNDGHDNRDSEQSRGSFNQRRNEGHDNNRDGEQGRGSMNQRGSGGGRNDGHDYNRDGDQSRGSGNQRGSGGGRNDAHDNNRDSEQSRGNFSRRESGGSNTTYHQRTSSPLDQKDSRRVEKNVAGSRDSSRGRPKSGPELSDKKETDSAECGVKTSDSGEISSSEKRVDSVERNHSHNKRFDSGDRYNRSRGGTGGGRRFNDQGSKGKGSEESNWRHGKDQDVNDKRDDRRDNFPRSGNRGGGGPRRQAGGNMSFKVVMEKDGDLFSAPPEHSLAHCVAEDLRMGSGIAVNFRQQFKQVDELLEQRKRVGQVAFLEDKGRFIYYLITKKRSSGKPLWSDFIASVEELKKMCVEKEVKNLAMPRIGCGLDRLEWWEVKRLLEDVFTDTGVSITAYNFLQNEEPESPLSKPKSTLYLMHERKNLVEIDAETGLMFLCCEESGATDRTIDSLDKKHNIMYELRSAKKTVGEVVAIQKGKEYLYGLVVKKSEKDPLSYVNLGKCLRKMRNTNSKDKYGYFGMEAFRDEKDPLTMEKVITCIRNTFGGVPYKLEFYICWPKELENDHQWDDQNTPNTTPSSK